MTMMKMMKRMSNTIGHRKPLACLSLLALLFIFMIFVLDTTSKDLDGHNDENDLVSDSGFSSVVVPDHDNEVNIVGDGSSFLDDKRRVQTGPNPLHNR